MMRISVSSLILVFLLGCFSYALAADELPEGALNGEEIVGLVSGQTLVTEESNGQNKTIYFFPEGELRQVSHDKDYLKGKWKVRDDRLCVTLKGDRDCRFVVRDKKGYRTYIPKLNDQHKPDEKIVSIKKGNQIMPQLDMKLKEGVGLPAGTLNAEEVLQLFYDRTVESVTAVKNRASRSYYDPDGEVRQYRNGDKRTGKWVVKENGRICLQMEDLPGKCRIIVKEKGEYRKYIVKRNGRHVHSVSYPEFRQGNPYHI